MKVKVTNKGLETFSIILSTKVPLVVRASMSVEKDLALVDVKKLKDLAQTHPSFNISVSTL